jgi:hypothetical protein
MPIGVALITPSDATIAARTSRACRTARPPKRAPAETRAKARGQGLGLRRVGVDERQLTRAQGEDRMRDRRTGAAGTEEADMAERDIAQSASKWRGEAGPIGIVSDAFAIPENDGVDRANRLGVGRKAVEQRQHGLLARMRDIDAGKSDRLR